jgi:WD40 repeat protein
VIDARGGVIWEKEYLQGSLACVAWSPGGEYLAVPLYMTLSDHTAIFTESGYPLGNLTSGIWEVVEWSPDGQYIVSGGYDGVLKIYDTEPISMIDEATCTATPFVVLLSMAIHTIATRRTA